MTHPLPPRRLGRRPVFFRRLELEPLEDRVCPDSKGFVGALYLGVLGRPDDPQGLAYWANGLDSGKPASAVVQGFLQSPEYFSHVVTIDYEQLLGRMPDARGMSSFVAQLVAGAAPLQTKIEFIASGEFASRAGPGPANLVTSIYSAVLLRTPDPAGRAFFVAEASAGLPGGTIARQMMGSREFLSDLVSTDYQRFLNRTPETSGVFLPETIASLAA
jgi:hypothetical protein